jgi:hypothetical protein
VESVKFKAKKGGQRKPTPKKATDGKPAVVEFTTIIYKYLLMSSSIVI